tara:strand:+ start:516 stop:1247 length:732 start_codon:yes stop_codon:yes gene_type:complete
MLLFKKNYLHFNEIESTNDYAFALKNKSIFREGLIISTDYQFNGKGTRLKRWDSVKNQNLLLSIIIEPKLKISNQFIINQFISLSILDFLKSLDLTAKIKFPNDIILDGSKISGILIQNIVSDSIITHSIVGVGINVNQCIFQKYNLPATSIFLHKKEKSSLKDVKCMLINKIEQRLNEYRFGKNFTKEYNEELFKLNQQHRFLIKNHIEIGILKEITVEGKVIVKTKNKLNSFFMNDIKYLF